MGALSLWSCHGAIGDEGGLILSALKPMSIPVASVVGVARVQVDGPAEVLNRQAWLVQIDVGAGPALVGVGVLREQLDQPVEVLDGLFGLLALDARKGPGGQSAGVSGSISRTALKSSTALS